MKDLSRRQFVKLGATATGAAALAGLSACSGDGGVASPAASTSSDGTIELTYWYCWTDKIKENNEERIQEFNDTIGKEKGIHVTAESQGSYDDLNSKLKSAFVAGEAPDVCVMVINSTKVFADGGMIQPIDEFIADDDLNDFWPGLMENCKVDADSLLQQDALREGRPRRLSRSRHLGRYGQGFRRSRQGRCQGLWLLR